MFPADEPPSPERRGAPRVWLAATTVLAVFVVAGLVAARDAESGDAGGEPTRLQEALDEALVSRVDRARLLDAMERGPSIGRPEAVERFVQAHEIARPVLLPERPFRRVAVDEPTRIALVFDDLGYAMDGLAAELLALDQPLTFAVLPGLPKSEEFAEAARARGHEVLLHIPMEPIDSRRHDPGGAALLTSLSPEENARRIGLQLASLRTYDGVSNHMGSRATAVAEVVDLVLAGMKRRDPSLFFFDSRTTPFSVVPERARHAGVPFLCNNLFLDGGDEESELPAVQTEHLAAIARRRGHAIGIGHVRPATVAAVRAAIEAWHVEGIRLVRLSDLSRR